MATIQAISKLLTLLQVYPNQPQDEKIRQVVVSEWARILADVPDELALTAYDEWSKSAEKFAPPPGWIYSRAKELAGVDSESLAEQAWQAVIEYNHGHGDPLEDELAKTIMRRLGWAAWDNVQVDDVHWWHDKFVKAYGDAHEKQVAALPAGEVAKMIGGK